MSRTVTPELTAMMTPIEAVLKPLRFRRGSVIHNGKWLSADWSSDHTFVMATVEPGDRWGELYVARRSDEQPWEANVPIRRVLAAMRRPTVRVPDRVTADIDVLEAWSTGMATALASIVDVLRGDALDVLDGLIASHRSVERQPDR